MAEPRRYGGPMHPDHAGSVASLDALVRRVEQAGPCVVLLVAAPGSGKSTLAAALAARLPDARVLSHAAHRAEVSATGHPADHAVGPQAGALLTERLVARCAAGQTTICDGTHHLARTRARLRAIAAAAGLPVLAVVLSTPLEVCVARQADRPGPRPGMVDGLRVPETEVRAVHHALAEARSALDGEGFEVCVVAPAVTTGPADLRAGWSRSSE